MAKKVASRHVKTKRSQGEADEIKELERGLVVLDPAVAAGDGASAQTRGGAGVWKFQDLPLSRYTQEGLKNARYTRMTAIQRAALPNALAGKDVLGAAKTGSGKTLAFLIPVLERLYRLQWGKLDGLGALVISPTRELAMQIFEELKKIGKPHDFSAGLLIGGKNVREEQSRVNAMNILVCTPGRLLQHMDETPGFDCSNLQVLVLDEADRILDMGFSASVNAIVENLPTKRQTMLFSATQTKSVNDLARLSLKDPTYISVHAEAAAPTPLKLQQAYVVCELSDKVNILWGFIKTHLKAKTLVFLSTCKQVKYMYSVFKKLQPGVPLRCMHGGMSQIKRMAVFYEFTEDKKGAVLFATDIAARGLDFPALNWVVQMDCPENVDAYIHRVGRTARYVSGGQSLLMLLPSERDAMVRQLEDKKVPIKELKVRSKQAQPVGPALQALLSKDNELKDLAQKAVQSYLRSVHLQPNRAVFNVTALPIAEFALSLGLASTPKLRFLRQQQQQRSAAAQDAASAEPRQIPPSHAALGDPGSRGRASAGAAAEAAAQDGTSGSDSKDDERPGVPSPSMQAAQQQVDGASASDDDDFMVVKQRNVYDVELPSEQGNGPRATGKGPKKKKLKIKPGVDSGSRKVFNDDGEAVEPLAQLQVPSTTSADGEEDLDAATAEERFARAREEMRTRDEADRAAYAERRRERARLKKERARARAAAEGSGGPAVAATLGAPSDKNGDGGDFRDEYATSTGGSGSDEENDDNLQGTGIVNGHGQKRKMDTGDAWLGATQKAARTDAGEIAHFGMRKCAGRGDAAKGGADVTALSVTEQEALALKLLSRK